MIPVAETECTEGADSGFLAALNILHA